MDWTDCKYCGTKIVWRHMPQGQYLPFNPGGGKHECGADTASIEDLYESLGRDDDEPNKATRPTKCWWCGADVYYHTNGYGDSVLFDELGWPWQIHPCWEEHRRSALPRRRRVRLDEDDFEDLYFAPFPAGDEAVGTKRSLVGFILRHGDSYLGSQSLGHDLLGEPVFKEIEIAVDNDTSYEALLPVAVANDIEDTAILEVDGVWAAPHGNSHASLIVTRLVARAFDRRGPNELIKWTLGDPLAYCYGCGVDLSECDGRDGLEWAFTEDLRPECSDCNAFRGDLEVEEFISRCKRVAENSRRPRP